MSPVVGGRLWQESDGRCAYCNIKLQPCEASRDHVIPVSKGGKGTITNLVLSCVVCNREKGVHSVEEFLETWWLAQRRKRVAKIEAHEVQMELLRRQGLR